jgi:hypothetical protein
MRWLVIDIAFLFPIMLLLIVQVIDWMQERRARKLRQPSSRDDRLQ